MREQWDHPRLAAVLMREQWDHPRLAEVLMREQWDHPKFAEVLNREQRDHPRCWWESSGIIRGWPRCWWESSGIIRGWPRCWWESSGIIRGWSRCWWEHLYHPRLAGVLMREQWNHSRWWASSWITRIWPSGIETTICLLLLFVLSDTDIWILLAVPKSSSIDKLDMGTMKIETLVSDIWYPLGLDFHFYTHQIYWADFRTKTMGR